MAGIRPLTYALTSLLAISAAGCFPEPYPHSNPNDPAYEGSPSESTPTAATDADSDGDPAATDCDDSDGSVYHGATEIPYDGKDNDCEGGDLTDVDGDGYDAEGVGGDDCDDDEGAVNPGATDTCNGVDDDCSGGVDDDVSEQDTFWADDDDDGYGDPDDTETACDRPDGYVNPGQEDCDDGDEDVHPRADEVCDGADQDCDDDVDEGVTTAYIVDLDDDGYGAIGGQTTEACSQPSGYSAVGGDCDDASASVHPGADEVCNGDDEDCDASIDEGVLTVFYLDEDGDTFGGDEVPACTQPQGTVRVGGDCDDSDVNVRPGAVEICDEGDDDCDQAVDEGVQSTFYEDNDGDGFGDSSATVLACEVPEGATTDADDCDDQDASTHPGAMEWCDGVKDSDCDGQEQPADTGLCTDDDGDGYIEAPGDQISIDCDDADPNANPGAAEIYDLVDNDCDGLVDEGTASFDDDEDGYTEEQGDCDDADPTVHPRAVEQCDAVDHDCDGQTSPGDRDGIGGDDCTDDDGDGYAETEGDLPGGDCDDEDADIHPGAVETADGLDQDCDGQKDNRIPVDAELLSGGVAALRIPGYVDVGSAMYNRPVGRAGERLLVRAIREAEGDAADEVILHLDPSEGSSATALFEGPAGSGLGLSAAFGDLDGDSSNDVVLGLPGLGKVCIFLAASATEEPPYTVDQADSCISADRLEDGVGEAGRLAVADLDEDSYADIILGAPGVGSAGGVYFFSGAEGFKASMTLEDATLVLTDPSGTGAGRLVQGPYNTPYGVAVAAVSDATATVEHVTVLFAQEELLTKLGRGIDLSEASLVVSLGAEALSLPRRVDVNSSGYHDLLISARSTDGTAAGLAILNTDDDGFKPGKSLSVLPTDLTLRPGSQGLTIGPVDVTSSQIDSARRLLVADPDAEVEGERAGAGAIYAVEVSSHGAPNGAVDVLADAWWIGAEAGDGLGTSALWFDVDGDALEELVAGAPGANGGEGLIYVVLRDLPFWLVF